MHSKEDVRKSIYFLRQRPVRSILIQNHNTSMPLTIAQYNHLPIGLRNTLEFILFLNSVRVRRAFGSVDELIS